MGLHSLGTTIATALLPLNAFDTVVVKEAQSGWVKKVTLHKQSRHYVVH